MPACASRALDYHRAMRYTFPAYPAPTRLTGRTQRPLTDRPLTPP